MEKERQLEQTDRNRMKSNSLSILCDIKFRTSFGSSDQSASAAMDDAASRQFSFFFFGYKEYSSS
jgi:hypothetical protein